MTPHGLAEGEQPQFDTAQQRPEMVRRIEATILSHLDVGNVSRSALGFCAYEILRAMLHPTDAMLMAIPSGILHENHDWRDMQELWRAMIDAALK